MPETPKGNRLRIVVVLIGILCLPTGFELLLPLFAFGNPLNIPVEQSVENRTDQVIRITPVGGFRNDPGYRGPLCLYRTRSPSIPTFRSGDFTLPPGSSLTFYYPVFKVFRMTELVIQDSEGHPFQLGGDAVGIWPPRPIIIEDFRNLPQPSPAVLQAADHADSINPAFVIVGVCVLILLTFTALLVIDLSKTLARRKRSETGSIA